MSTWPTLTDYCAALQHPARVFRDQRLKECTAEVNKMGVPKGRAGNFAVVFKLTHTRTREVTAVRLFLNAEKEREERYGAVHEHLQKNRLPCLIGFAFDPKGIRIAGEWYPMQAMDWVSGPNLGGWVKDCVQRRETARLQQTAEHWANLIAELTSARIAHGDLQHDNIIVVGQDKPVLVDYDCMCVPRLVGHRPLEIGKPAYQHPLRAHQKKLSLDFDRFSAWIILLALRALAVDLSLWDRYVTRTDNENLLFTADDIRNPDQSQLWRELLKFPDKEVQDWAGRVWETLPDKPFDSIPPVDTDPFKLLRQLCGSMPRDWETINREAARLRTAQKPTPPDLTSDVALAGSRCDCRKRLEEALQSSSARRIKAAYEPRWLDDWAACNSLLAPARKAIDQVKLLDELEVCRPQPGGRQFVALWDQYAARLRGVTEVKPLQEEAEVWRRRIKACDLFIGVIGNSSSGERALADAWVQVEQAGGHPDAEPHRLRADLARRRTTRLKVLDAVPAQISEVNDRRLISAWDLALLQGCQEGTQFLPRVEAAEYRLGVIQNLDNVITLADQGGASEKDIVEAVTGLPPGYGYAHQPRVEQAKQWVNLAADLVQVLSAVPPSDRAIASVWEKTLKAGKAPRDPAVRKRCELAVSRRDLLAKLAAIGVPLLADEQDKQWLRQWDSALLLGCYDIESPCGPQYSYADRYQLAVNRIKAWQALEEVLNRRDLSGIRASLADPSMVDYPPARQRQAEIAELLQLANEVERIIDLLRKRKNDVIAPRDLDFIRDYPALFRPYQSLIEQALTAWLSQGVALRPGDPLFAALPSGDAGTVRWTWPDAGRITYCLLAWESDRFLTLPPVGDGLAPVNSSTSPPTGSDRTHGTMERLVAVYHTEHRLEQGGKSLRFPPAWRRAYVTMWPVIDLDWMKIVGSRVELGPIPLGTRPPPNAGRKRLW